MSERSAQALFLLVLVSAHALVLASLSVHCPKTGEWAWKGECDD